jgi:hypothetical protein
MNDKTAGVPEVIALYREDEDGSDQLAGWAMVIPGTEKVVAYVPPSTGVGTGLVNAFASLLSAGRILSHMGIYPVADLAPLLGDPPAPQ